MEPYWGDEVMLHAVLISVLLVRKWSALRSSRFVQENGWIQDVTANRKLSACDEN